MLKSGLNGLGIEPVVQCCRAVPRGSLPRPKSNRGDRAKIKPLRQEYLGDHRPAGMLLEVSPLMSSNLKVEIDLEAVLE